MLTKMSAKPLRNTKEGHIFIVLKGQLKKGDKVYKC